MARHLVRLRRDQRGVSIVFANLLMVVMTIGMAGSFFVMATSLISPYTPPSSTFIALQSAGTYASHAPGYCCLNDSFVQVVEMAGDAVFWTPTLQYQIDSYTGEVLIRGDLTPIIGDDFYLGVFHAGPGFASVPVVGYIDVAPLDQVSVADTIQIYGMSKEYHGATLKVFDTAGILSQSAID